MNKIKVILLSALIIGFVACKKESVSPANDSGNNQPKSKWAIINDIWTLTETFENDVQKTSNGTGKSEFNKYGNFRTEIGGVMSDIGVYKFLGSDSARLLVTLTGMSPNEWSIKQIDDKNLKVEFNVSGKKYNYNYKK